MERSDHRDLRSHSRSSGASAYYIYLRSKAVGGAIKTGVDNAKTFVKGGADAVKDKNISKQVDDYVAKNKGDKPIRKIDPTPYNKPKSKDTGLSFGDAIKASQTDAGKDLTKSIKSKSTNPSGKELPKAKAVLTTYKRSTCHQ